jgi:hypothetical protein
MRNIASDFAARTKRRLLISAISALVGLPAMCCCLVLIFTVLFPQLDRIAASGNSNTTIYIMLGIGLVTVAGLIAVPMLVLFATTLVRARALDAIFIPLGLTGSSYMLYGRQYQGQIGGRDMNIYIYRGPTVEIRLKAATQTRLQVMPKDSLPASVSHIFEKNPLVTGNPALESYAIYPIDSAWTLGLLAEQQAVTAIHTLMTLGADWAIFRHVEIQPGEVLLYLNRTRKMFANSIDLSAIQTWLDALKMLAQAVESQPAPEVTAQPLTGSSRQSRQKMSNFLVAAIIAIVFVMPLCFIAIGVGAYLIVTLLG